MLAVGWGGGGLVLGWLLYCTVLYCVVLYCTVPHHTCGLHLSLGGIGVGRRLGTRWTGGELITGHFIYRFEILAEERETHWLPLSVLDCKMSVNAGNTEWLLRPPHPRNASCLPWPPLGNPGSLHLISCFRLNPGWFSLTLTAPRSAMAIESPTIHKCVQNSQQNYSHITQTRGGQRARSLSASYRPRHAVSTEWLRCICGNNIIQSLYWVSAEWKIANFLETKLVYQKIAHANTKVNCGAFILYFLFYHFLVFEPSCLHQQFRRYIFCYLKVSLEKQQCFWCCNRESFTYIENLVIFL